MNERLPQHRSREIVQQEIEALGRRLERARENENPLERASQIDNLLEKLEELEEELEELGNQ